MYLRTLSHLICVDGKLAVLLPPGAHHLSVRFVGTWWAAR